MLGVLMVKFPDVSVVLEHFHVVQLSVFYLVAQICLCS